MLKGRGRDPRVLTSPPPAQLAARVPAPTQGVRPQPQMHSSSKLTLRTPTLSRAPIAKPEPDYEVVEFPSEQYVNAKLQPPPPPPPRPPTGHPVEAASCGLCGGGGARVRCTECGRRALCASCDDMYHRHPKRRHHQRQALSLNQMRDERPPLPPKAAPPVPPPRRHKISGDRMSASPRPPSVAEQRNSTLGSHSMNPMMHTQTMPLNNRPSQHSQQIPPHLQKLAAGPTHLGSVPYLPAAHHSPAPVVPAQTNTLGHLTGWGRPRGSLPGFNVPPNMMQQQMGPESWESPESVQAQNWGRPMRRGASVLELSGGSMGGMGGMVGAGCPGCAGCAGGWRYGSCASLDHQPWAAWPPACCHPPAPLAHPHAHAHPHVHAPQTPQPYRRVDSRAVSRAASRAGSRAASPAMSVRSRASRRPKHRTPSPPPLPSSDADSESESDSDHEAPPKQEEAEEWLGPAPAPAAAAWQCEHCTFVNEPGERVCAVCCRTPTAAPKIVQAPGDATSGRRADSPRTVAENARSVADSARSVAESARGISRLELDDDPPPPRTVNRVASPSPVRVVDSRTYQNGETTTNKTAPKKERISTGCGPSPPREENNLKQKNRLVTPTREQSVEPSRRHDMGVGPSPPRETQHSISVGPSPPRQNISMKVSPYREVKQPEPPVRYSISVGPSPPRENTIRASPVQKKSAGTSPPRDAIESRSSSTSLRANVSNTGTSPPPQSISTQTYEVPNAWERAPSASRSRARRRFRDDSRRERSHSRHSLSSDTRVSHHEGGNCARRADSPRTIAENARSVADSARSVAESARGISRLDLDDDPPPPRTVNLVASPSPVRIVESRTHQNGETTTNKTAPKKERISTGCGPSPPREENHQKQINRLVTPTREQSVEPSRRHDMGVGPSPPRETQHTISVGPSPPRQNISMRVSPYREVKQPEPPVRHSISVGPSPPRENTIRASPVQKKSAGTSPPRDVIESRSSSTSLRANVSNTGTSPPPQSISTQTYEVPNAWERAPSASRSRARRRFRDDSRRERSHSRHSLSSDTRESERSARTSGGGGGRWEWRETRDSSPPEWSGSERRPPARLTRRASHLDLRREPRAPRRASYYSQAASPEPGRAMSMEALAGAGAAGAASRGLELARLMAEAERLGFSAAEVQAALAQSPAAPLAWLRGRWPSLCAGVRAAAARLAPNARVSELEARAALARHRGAMWPAVTDCVERHRRQTEQGTSSERRLRGRVWGSPAGADDDAAPPPRAHTRAEDSSDEYEPPPNKLRDDDWMYLPLDAAREPVEPWAVVPDPYDDVADDVAADLKRLLVGASAPVIPDDLVLGGFLPDELAAMSAADGNVGGKPHLLDFIQSENDFIEAYNALTRSSPLPNVNNRKDGSDGAHFSAKINSKRDTHDVDENDLYSNIEKNTNINNNINMQTNHISHESIDSNKLKKRSPEKDKSNESLEVTLNNVYTIQQTSQHSSSPTKPNIAADVDRITNITLNSSQQFDTANKDLTSNVEIENASISTTNAEPILSDVPITSPIPKTVTETNNVKNTSPTPQVAVQKNIRKVTPPIQKVTTVNNIEKTQADIQSQDKSNNLNDLVDNTQRLIQQMRDEINSDINSIDSRNISQSEADSSSNESDISTEHESSYSDTEDKETDELSTNESESSDEESEEDRLHERRPTIIQRTSSEENDQFEEAMDHIEDQMEDFKNTNIEILDSIARSLQEEHTISLTIDEPKITNERREDLNNNLFVEVNSFEEIYAQLNSNNKGKVSPTRPDHNKSNDQQNSRSELTSNNVQSVITNNKNDKQKSPDNASIGNQNNIISIQDEPKHVSPEPVKIPRINITKQLVAISTFKAMPPIQLIISENNQIALNAIIEHLEGIDEINNEIQEHTVVQITEETSALENDFIITETPVTSMKSLPQSSDEDDSMGTADSDVTPTEQTDLVDDDNTILENNTNTQENLSNKITENVDRTESKDVSDILDNKVEINNEVSDSNNKSPEKIITKPQNQSKINKTFNAIKSNIPKLVKVVQNNKQKGDKTSPKVIASKVPVRRGSLKQYPAPAPPKSHFGNIQSGHVKQLQTRLFDNKFPKTSISVPSTVEAKPSTSTMHKKKPAPPPPTQEAKQSSPSKAPPPKEKKGNFFRESCRTEDEWTESDAEDTPVPFSKESEEPNRPPSPPPPVTVRRVSGQIIDLAKVRIPEGSPERQARMLLAEGASETWEQARLAVELVSRGAEAAAALLAALECADLPAALAYLHQDCELCAERLPEHEMVSMLRCTHRCCRSCARLYFTVQVTERSIADCVCPYCKLPELESLPEDEWLEYFAHLDIQLKTLLEADVHELFQRKLRDRTLARDPNFRWCMECSSGFFVHPKQKKIRCPECRSVSCAKCRKQWSVNHEGLTCEQYTAWLEDNDPERAIAAVQQHLRENGLECPRCHFKYSLSRGGCMHFTCTQCKYEFCYGCGKPFMMGARCGLSEYCAKLGLHAHHPRNCLFYLRDKEPHELQTLLQMNNVEYETAAPEGSPNRCPIQLQRETPTGLVDGTCGSEAPANYAGLCKNHYLEYLSRVVRARGLDPLPLLDVGDLETLVRRAALRPPPRPYGSLDGLYRRALQEIVKEKIPLD
ncbi:uncharacterized protein LOC114359868 [Ostrinia furnacalis]|uniref:uncharacterized protein LOC114359868 n=1 Tax=Ostrinia furnacalis TaxID=93504 RepID=UPI00103E59EE|nr:uncharacterized protein LOC114359868 [Ostrinia furnacalis]